MSEARLNSYFIIYIGIIAIFVILGILIAWSSNEWHAQIFRIYQFVTLVYAINNFGYLRIWLSPYMRPEHIFLIHEIINISLTIAVGEFNFTFLKDMGAGRKQLIPVAILLVLNASLYIFAISGYSLFSLRTNIQRAGLYIINTLIFAFMVPNKSTSSFRIPKLLF